MSWARTWAIVPLRGGIEAGFVVSIVHLQAFCSNTALSQACKDLYVDLQAFVRKIKVRLIVLL